MNYVYILKCSDSTLYTGWTSNLKNRIETHNAGKGAKYTRGRLPVKLVYFEVFSEKREAQSREWKIKRLSRGEKLELVEAFKEKNVEEVNIYEKKINL